MENCVYVLKSKIVEKSYVGSTTDLKRRLKEHNAGKSYFTSKYRPWEIVHVEKFENISQARKREKYLKSRSGRNFLKNVVFK